MNRHLNTLKLIIDKYSGYVGVWWWICLITYMKMTPQKELEIGKRYGNVTVKEWVNSRSVKYVCDCGKEKSCEIYDLRRGRIISCGCWKQGDEYKQTMRHLQAERVKNGTSGLNIGGDHITDDLTPFRYLWKCINNKGRKGVVDLTIEDLKNIWEAQSGRCVYTDTELILPTHVDNQKYCDDWLVASVDRIDSELPYCKNNVQFISRTSNYAKNNMSDKQMKEFILFIRK